MIVIDFIKQIFCKHEWIIGHVTAHYDPEVDLTMPVKRTRLLTCRFCLKQKRILA